MAGSGARLLFVDDEPSIRMTLPPVLQKAGFEVRIAESVSDALFEINSRQFDILITDLNIGEEGDGFLVTSAMRHVQPECLTFILTGYPAFETALQAIHNHVDDYLVKPVDISSLTKTLGEKLQNRGSRTPFGAKRLSAVLKGEAEEIVGRAALASSQNGNRHTSEQELSRLLNALVEQLELDLEAPDADLVRSAREYGKKQAQAKYAPTALVNQFRHLEQEVYHAVQKNMTGMDFPTLISDLRRLSAGVYGLLEGSLNAYGSMGTATTAKKTVTKARKRVVSQKRRPAR
jgi:ActR/RegA family two-component response regulator